MDDITFGFQAAAAGRGGQSDHELYRDLMELPKVLMLKTGLVDEQEADQIIKERNDALQAIAVADFGGGIGDDGEAVA